MTHPRDRLAERIRFYGIANVRVTPELTPEEQAFATVADAVEAMVLDDLLLPVVSEELLELFARIIGNEFYTAGAWVRFARERPRDWAEALRKAQRHRRIAKELRALVRKLEGVRG